jgi:hypothetical protein
MVSLCLGKCEIGSVDIASGEMDVAGRNLRALNPAKPATELRFGQPVRELCRATMSEVMRIDWFLDTSTFSGAFEKSKPDVIVSNLLVRGSLVDLTPQRSLRTRIWMCFEPLCDVGFGFDKEETSRSSFPHNDDTLPDVSLFDISDTEIDEFAYPSARFPQDCDECSISIVHTVLNHGSDIVWRE